MKKIRVVTRMNNQERRSKLTSRKLWMCIVVFCGSIATSIAALNSQYELVQAIGTTAGIISAAASGVVYVLTEGAIDKESVKANSVQMSVALTSGDKTVVKEALAQTSAAPQEGTPKDGQDS